MELITHYRDNDALRSSFNALAEQTFGLNFESWYQNGFWQDHYEPYSVLEDGKIVANVSVNQTDMVIRGERKKLYQLGTVMTAPEYRNRGYIRAIMAQIGKDISDADGVYLFANDSVLDFYPKFGFEQGREYVYSREISQTGPAFVEQVLMDGPAKWERLQKAMEASRFQDACHMVDNHGLIFFYAAQFMQDCVYFSDALDAWVIAEQENGVLMHHNVFSSREVTLDAVIAAFGGEVTRVTLGFPPADPSGFECRELKEEDCTFFVKGEAFRDFGEKGLRIPSLSHA